MTCKTKKLNKKNTYTYIYSDFLEFIKVLDSNEKTRKNHEAV